MRAKRAREGEKGARVFEGRQSTYDGRTRARGGQAVKGARLRFPFGKFGFVVRQTRGGGGGEKDRISRGGWRRRHAALLLIVVVGGVVAVVCGECGVQCRG